MDAFETADALIRLIGLWAPYGYTVTYVNGVWHAEHESTTEKWEANAASNQELHLAMFRHYQGGLRMPTLEPWRPDGDGEAATS